MGRIEKLRQLYKEDGLRSFKEISEALEKCNIKLQDSTIRTQLSLLSNEAKEIKEKENRLGNDKMGPAPFVYDHIPADDPLKDDIV